RPNDVEFLIVSSGAFSKVDMHRRAIESANEAVRLAPENVEALTAYAEAMAIFGSAQTEEADRRMWMEDALEAAEKAIQINPRHEDAYSVVAMLTGPSAPTPDLRAYNSMKRRLKGEHPESRLSVLLDARDEITQRRFESALERVVDLYLSDPSDASSLAIAVNAWSNLQRLDDANQWLTKQLIERPGGPELLEYWTRVQLLRTDTAYAVEFLKREVESDATNFAARRLLESAYRAARNFEGMLKLREARLLTRPEGTRRAMDIAAAYADAGRFEEAYASLDWINDHVKDARRSHLMKAIEISRRLVLDTARRDELVARLAMSTLDRFPGSSLRLYQVGLVALAQLDGADDRFDQLAQRAVAHADGAMDSTNEALRNWQGIAQSLLQAGLAPAAGRMLRIRLRGDPGFDLQSTLSLALATLAVDAGIPDNAAETIQRVRDLDEREKLSLLARGQGEFNLIDMLHNVSNLHSIIGDRADSNRILEECLTLDPDFAMGMNNLGYSRIEAGHEDEWTLQLLDDAFRLLPNDPNVLDSIGWLRYKQGIFEDQASEDGEKTPALLGAKSLIRRVMVQSRDPNPAVIDHLADTLWRLGKPTEAATMWEKVSLMVEDSDRENQFLKFYEQYQLEFSGLLVTDPKIIYEREDGVLRDSLRAKLEAVERGEEPPIALTFEELRQLDAAGED
ncbi:MAG: hypothetical protein O7G85_14045, partial [Planctomycetota bacterium]|nr:hypothetical protein [Planctomycetota bacterium]